MPSDALEHDQQQQQQRRGDRRGAAPLNESRLAGALDRDRILYSTEFRRLSGVTQVVSPGQEEIFHNRLTHTLKVAQVGRRLAERLNANCPEACISWGGADPDVVEAAAMAHDLGHPPFGHLAEEELDRCIRNAIAGEPSGQLQGTPVNKPTDPKDGFGPSEGYEGNAQSFRIVTRLAIRKDADSPFGLDLSRATLNATLKYPRLFSPATPKYGAYQADEEAFRFAREGSPTTDAVPCLEAQIMDWADDITYSVHDVEDFYRAGLIPLDRLVNHTLEQNRFQQWVESRWPRISAKNGLGQMSFITIISNIFSALIQVGGPYNGTKESRAQIYKVSSELINRFVTGTMVRKLATGITEALDIPQKLRAEVAILKELIWRYVIQSPALAAQQHGQREVIRSLFRILYDATDDGRHYLFPAAFRDAAQQFSTETASADRARLVADAVASLSDNQALRLYQRLTASSQGSVLDPIIR
jgi:dGTPase